MLSRLFAKSSRWPVRPASFRRRKIGMMMSFDTMIESATESTMTIAVAAEKPPMKVISETICICPASGRDNT
ncbi:hypothetical protein AJ87_05640 [Rhizobium yanglingense]|nr:hypothetical protein AJ87_05640 [Rhizobium yanglingense]